MALKHFKPGTPSLRGTVLVDRSDLFTCVIQSICITPWGRVIKSLTFVGKEKR
ncbi:hypothetical protein JGUZn3_06210 [Entomobacter blattae]|uniref:Uncharacterized protein n=1 Tax=Entomobacter blattae TaxID=2762277 RepID=A0A7H1NQ03_9PROT|nr:hypothetical protein JGUZn3_06210 [Entomobacter blattae]